MEIFAPDTNFFLQCSPAEQLDWKRVTQADEVVLLVVREVRKELDRLKSGGNARRSKRARAASSLLRRFTTERLDEIELKASGPRLILKTASRPSPDSLPANFQIDSADERVVAEVYAATAVIGGLTFLSHDTVPLEDAAELGLQTQVIPDDWLLDPEPNELERQLSDVKRRMKALEGRVPSVVVEVPITADGHVVLTTRYFPMLSDAFIARAMSAVKAKYPLKPNQASTSGLGTVIRDLENIDKARWARFEEAYGKWLEDIRRQLNDACRFFTEDPNGAKLPLTISNIGSAGAENLIIKIEALGDFHLVDPDSLDEDTDQFFPEPPARPRSALVEGLMGFQRANYGLPRLDDSVFKPRFHTPAMARDRHAIYWEFDDDRNARFIEGQCRDFRHGLVPDEVVLLIERTAIGEETIQGALYILVSAGNLAEASRKTYPVRIESELMDTEQLVRELFARELAIVV